MATIALIQSRKPCSSLPLHNLHLPIRGLQEGATRERTEESPQPRSVCRQMGGGQGGRSSGRPPAEVATSDSEKAAKARKITNNNRGYGVEPGRVDATHQSHRREFHQTPSPKFRSRLRECGDEASSRGRRKEEEEKRNQVSSLFLPCKKTFIS